MFSTGSLEKNSSTLAESHSPGRNKFPVGLNPLGDESQQNSRIQSAVHRYNNSTVGSFARSINERSIPSPFRHAFLKNTQKYKNFESDKEESQSSFKKSHNHYQGVGNFPVVHLRKSEIITRPIRRNMNNEFKIQLPELPFNRFLNHSPDICLDTKTSTRSVLDVLQDLSRKRIHTKDDNEVTKRKCKGLGGDAPLDIEAPYKPLFVPKIKTSAVTLRDNTTQTQDLPPLELSPSRKNDKVLSNKKDDDPKAELRRKLARQNNEIFASLSSSTLMYPLKRNSGKLSQQKDDPKQNDQNAKRVKYFFEEKNNKKIQNGDVSSKDLLTTSNGDITSSKIEKRHKTIDSKLSPNKDRLTTIFLEMQNTNPIVEVLSNNQAVTSVDGAQPPKTLIADKGTEEKLISENVNVQTEKIGTDPESVNKNNTSVSTAGTTADSKQSDDKITNFFINNADSGNKDISLNEKNSISSEVVTTASFGISTSTTINFGVTSTNSTLKFPLVSTVSSSPTQAPIFSTGISQKGNMFDMNSSIGGNSSIKNVSENTKTDTGIVSSEANSANQKLLFQPPTSAAGFSLTEGIGQQSTGTGMFKFGIGGMNSMPSQSAPSEEKVTSDGAKEGEKTVLGVCNTTNSQALSGFSSSISGTIGQSPFSVNSGTPTTTTFSQSQQNPPVFSFTDKSSNVTNQTVEKPTFQFGFNPTTTSNSIPTSLFTTGAAGAAGAKREEKPAPEGTTESKTAPNPESSIANPSITSFPASTFQSNPFSTSAPTFGQPTVTSTQSVMPFKFGEKTETAKQNGDNPLPGIGTNFFDQKKPGLFAFGQKSQVSLGTATSEPPASQSNLFQQGTFTFGQKTSTPTSTASQTSTSSNLFGQNTSPQSNIFQQAVVSQAGTTANPTLNSNSPFGVSSQASDPLNKTQVPSFLATTSTSTGIMNNTFTQNKLNAPTFGQSTPSFGQTTTTNFSGEKNIFGSGSTQTTPAFGTASTGQPGSFSQTFGDSSKQQSTTNQTSSFFSQPPATQSSGFPSNPGFGTTTFGQTPSADGNIFGQKSVSGFEQNQNQTTPFGQSSTAQPFGAQTGFSFGSTATTTSSGFTLSTSSTTAPVFGFGNTTKTTSASTPSFGFTGSSQPESSSQPLFAFNNQPQANNTFKFGNTTTKDTPTFGSTGSASSTFSFNSTPSTSEAAKPAASVFNFGSPQTTSANTGFNFGASQSPVFSFGSSGTAAGGSKFSFSATPPSAGIFTPGATPSPSSVSLQGVFSIGSGSSQPRNRSATARSRRRQ